MTWRGGTFTASLTEIRGHVPLENGRRSTLSAHEPGGQWVIR